MLLKSRTFEIKSVFLQATTLTQCHNFEYSNNIFTLKVIIST